MIALTLFGYHDNHNLMRKLSMDFILQRHIHCTKGRIITHEYNY